MTRSIRFRDIPQFPSAHYESNAPLGYLARTVADHTRDYGLNLNPDFQRDHVWSMEQRRLYMEYLLSGGEGSNQLCFNCPSWNRSMSPGDTYEILDGKQRLTTALMFLEDGVTVFGGCVFSEFKDRPDLSCGFRWRIFNLPTRADVLRYYLAMNKGGTPHTEAELMRVQTLLEIELANEASRRSLA